ncbi:exosortase C-terminal domain/associated protein EpsI [Candidatus Nitrospira bockiana]
MKLSAHAFVGLGLLLGMLLLSRQYNREEAVPVRQPFDHFPAVIGAWTGEDMGLPQEVRDVLQADDFMMRVYRNPAGEEVSLFVGYYRSQRTGATYHSPLNCLPGGGWAILSREEWPVTVGSRPLRVNRVVIQKGLDRQVVLYWYQDRGRVVTSEYRAKAYLVWDAMRRNRTDGALVRVSLPLIGSAEAADRTAVQFLQQVVPLFPAFLPD